MNSAEKKAPEPSMDDIISSIRNIIADDAQETVPAPEAPVQTAPAVEAPSPAIVQLTENQIAEPAIEQVNGAFASPDAVVPAPEPAAIPEPAIAQSTPDLAVANEIDSVPGLVAAPEMHIAATVAPEPIPTPVAPELTISEPLTPATPLEPAPINDLTAAAPSPTVVPAAPEAMMAPAPEVAMVPEPAVPELNPQVPAAIIEDDIAFVTPQVSQNSLAEATPAPAAPPMSATSDPVEEMMQSVNADQADSDLVNNGVDPDKILEGMEPAGAEVAPSAALVEPAPVEQAPVIDPAPSVIAVADQAPVVLDASQVTPEDAVAITAVADATKKALTGASPSEPAAVAPQKKAGNSLEDSVKAMLKPMIKEWLDDNMPRILEGAIKEEVDLPDSDKT